MPIYSECWWDSVFVDVLFSNIPGMVIAQVLIHYFKFEKFDWFGREGAKSILGWDIWYK